MQLGSSFKLQNGDEIRGLDECLVFGAFLFSESSLIGSFGKPSQFVLNRSSKLQPNHATRRLSVRQRLNDSSKPSSPAPALMFLTFA